MADLRARLVVMPRQLTSDGLGLYGPAIESHMGPAASYAQQIKNYSRGGRRSPDHKYEPPRMDKGSSITTKAVLGAPNLSLASTSKVEVNNLLARHKNGRMRRLCLAFSKTLQGHRAAVSLCYVHFNFCHVLRTTRTTPALAAGVTDHLWDLEEFMGAVLSEAPGARPTAQPLTIPKPEGTARELPGGRGWLHVVSGGGGAPAPSPAPATPPAAPAAAVPWRAPGRSNSTVSPGRRARARCPRSGRRSTCSIRPPDHLRLDNVRHSTNNVPHGTFYHAHHSDRRGSQARDRAGRAS